MEIRIEMPESGIKKIRALNPKITQAMNDGIKDASFILQGGIVKSMKGTPKIGRTYVKTKSGLEHISSGPNNAPAIDSGRLVGSIRINHKYLTADVGTNVIYAKYLEKGTSNMKRRPIFETALKKTNKSISRIIADSIEQAIAL